MRQSWEEYFINQAVQISQRGTCPRLHVGAVITRDKRIIATGYNGSIHNDDHCEDVGCYVVDGHCIRTIHAESNAITQCSKFGIETNGTHIYVTHLPCLSCTKQIIQAGINKIFYRESYRPNDYALELIKKAGIELVQVATEDCSG